MHSVGNSKSADQLAYETCLQLESTSTECLHAAGISFDLQKCFDSVPVSLALDIFSARGADLRVVQALRSFYRNHRKYFRLEGHHSEAFKPACGIIQGCPLSMLLLTSVVTCWLEYNATAIPSAVSRAYADDMSAVVSGHNKQAVKTDLNTVYKETDKFSSLAGMTISKKKSFTFGDKAFRGCVPQVQEHMDTFRLVGCNIKIKHIKRWTPLENSRFLDWKLVIQRIRPLPISWFEKVNLIRSMMPKLTFGQGLHCLQIPKDVARTMRATVIKTLLNADNYNSAVNAVFALLTPPIVDPVFALDLSAFQLIRRMYPDPDDRKTLLDKISKVQEDSDGPVVRAKQLLDSPVFGNVMRDFVHNVLPPNKWEHELREAYRTQAWQLLGRDRPQHFAGITPGVDRRRTLQYLHILKDQADALQQQCDLGTTINPEPMNDPRAKLKVLRLLLTGGLQTPERQHRHKQKEGKVQCLCKAGEPTLHHTWCCPRFAAIRQPIFAKLNKPVEELPRCFSCCAIVPQNFVMEAQDVVFVQDVLVQIWQHHIADWCHGEENFLIIPDNPDNPPPNSAIPPPTDSNAASSSNAALPARPVPKNGHILKLLPEGGVFCQLCGKSTKLLKHQRLKILSRPCQNPNLPPEQWLSKPGALSSAPRLEKAWNELLEKHNRPKHQLFWNQKCGKHKNQPDFGKLWCEKCGREWAWMHRHNNLPITKCIPTPDSPSPPAWVVSERENPDRIIFSNQSSQNSNSTSANAPRRRLVGKQTVTQQGHASIPRSGVG